MPITVKIDESTDVRLNLCCEREFLTYSDGGARRLLNFSTYQFWEVVDRDGVQRCILLRQKMLHDRPDYYHVEDLRLFYGLLARYDTAHRQPKDDVLLRDWLSMLDTLCRRDELQDGFPMAQSS